MKIHVLDPSAVLHVQVFDKGNLSKKLVGQWCMTLKWLPTSIPDIVGTQTSK